MEWIRLASHLHMPLSECKRKTSSMDFVKWRIYLNEEELNGFHREDYFLAQIAQYIVKANSKDPKSVKIDPFLLKFSVEKPKLKDSDLSIEEKKKRMLASRAAWGAILGVAIPLDDLLEDVDEDG